VFSKFEFETKRAKMSHKTLARVFYRWNGSQEKENPGNIFSKMNENIDLVMSRRVYLLQLFIKHKHKHIVNINVH